ncbi:MAG TPA: hypothetical protein VGT61_01765 [Thermomicrobiales bacterium]|jgi:hypothetical protein|nr:hypothetical protein [Thermomicrobiales bacterium]
MPIQAPSMTPTSSRSVNPKDDPDSQRAVKENRPPMEKVDGPNVACFLFAGTGATTLPKTPAAAAMNGAGFGEAAE